VRRKEVLQRSLKFKQYKGNFFDVHKKTDKHDP